MPVDVHTAARKGNVSVVTKYVRAGGDLYARDRYGNPPLHVAAYHGREACVLALLRAGVDPEALSRTGHTALQFAERKGQKGCVKILSAPRKKPDTDSIKNKNKKDKEKDSSATTTTNPADQPPPPPPTGTGAGYAATAAVGKEADAEGGGWHLCYDDAGNAYYYSEVTGESVWADPWQDVPSSYPVGSDASQYQQHTTSQADAYQTPEGWVMHFDSNTGYAYYLHEATNNSVWANNDGSFPADGVPDVTGSSEGHHDLYNANGEGAGGFQQWDFGVFGGGDRPPPTAPPLFSASLELAQGQNGEVHGGAGMYQDAHHGIMASNKFFGASHPEVFPSSSGGSPMACAPPAMESGGTRSSCTPRQQAAPPTDDGSLTGHDERNHHHQHHQGVNQHSPSGVHSRSHSPHASAPAAAGPSVSQSSDVHHGYGVSNTAAGVANSKQTFRLGFGVVTVEDALDERGSHRSFSDSDSTRCYAPSSNNGDGAPPLDSSPLKAHAPDTPSPSTTVSPVTDSSEAVHHSPTYGNHGGGGGSLANMNPYETAQMSRETNRLQPLPHPPGQPNPHPPLPPGSSPSRPRSAETPHKGFQDRAGAAPVDYCRAAFASGYPATADRSSSGGGGGQTVGVNVDESLARAAEYAMYIGDRNDASAGGEGM